jgi:hypothetical protein
MTINRKFLESRIKYKDGQQNGGSDNRAILKPLEIGKHIILSLKMGFST